MKEFFERSKLTLVFGFAFIVAIVLMFVDPNSQSNRLGTYIFIFFLILLIGYSILNIIIRQAIYFVWIKKRNSEIKKLAESFGLNFTEPQKGVSYKFIRFLFRDYPINKIEGSIGIHSVVISDVLKSNIFDMLTPYMRQTEIYLDGKRINSSIKQSGFGNTLFLSPVEDIRNFLSELQTSRKEIKNPNELKSISGFNYATLAWVVLILLGIIFSIFQN